MKRAIVLVMFMGFVVGCNMMHVTSKNKEKFSASQEITTKCCDLGSFRSIVLSGNIEAELANGPYAIEVIGVGAEKYNCRNSVVNQALYVNGVDKNRSDTVIKITAPELRCITVTGSAVIRSKNFKTNKLTIAAKENGSINLEGKFNVDKISQFGRGRINIDWIDSDKLLIGANNSGPICLAGAVENMVVKLEKDSMLSARYLRAKKASVIAANRAQAEVLVINTLGAFAVGKSNVYYYKKPENLTVVTRDSGNVLQLGRVK